MTSLPTFSGRSELDQTSSDHIKRYKKVNQYVLLKLLGEGSFAKVYLGFDIQTHGYYAVKQVKLKGLARTHSGISQLEMEIEIMRGLHHQNIANLHEVIHVPKLNIVYMVIDYADCGSISSILESGFTFDLAENRGVFRQIVEGVSFLHDNGIVHQDLKPANIMMKSDGSVLIADFGIGHSFQSAAITVGTPAYQAPEVIDECCEELEGDPGKEDVWSLGVTFFEMTFGELPFDGANVFEIVRSITMSAERIEPPDECDEGLWDLIQGMLKVDPKERLGIKEVKSHLFFEEGEDNTCSDLMAETLPEFDSKITIEQIDGRICGDGYSFSAADQSFRTKLGSYQAPFRSFC